MSKFRRQLMMSALVEPPTPPPTPKERLMQLGCIMWFPLDETNGLNDVVGQKEIVNITSGAVVYSAGALSHIVYLGALNTAVASIDVSYTSTDFTDGCWSSVTQARRHNNSSYRGSANVVWTNHSTSNSPFPAVNAAGTGDTRQWTDDNFHTTITVMNSAGGRKFYYDGSLIIDDQNVPSPPWGCTKFNFLSYISWSNNKRLFFRNYLLFNRALTADEVAEVNTIINSL